MKKIIILLLTLFLVGCSSSAPMTEESAKQFLEEKGYTVIEPIETTASNIQEEKNDKVTEETTTESDTQETSKEPLVLPDPITYTGSGDDVIEIETFDLAWYLHIEGNSEARHFAIKGYDEEDNKTELFVNTTSKYSGDVLDPSLKTKVLEITANGDWSITVAPILSLPMYVKGDTIEGTGDSIVPLISSSSTMTIAYYGDSNFVVREFTENRTNLLVNEIGAYDGKVKSSSDAFLLLVKASGDWTITLE